MKNQFVKQFENNIKFIYSCFDRVIVRGYIRKFFALGFVVLFLKAMGFTKKTKGVLRIFTDQLNAHISKEASKDNIPNYMVAFCQWWKKWRQTSICRKKDIIAKSFQEKATMFSAFSLTKSLSKL
jgi:hypothetical protein